MEKEKNNCPQLRDVPVGSEDAQSLSDNMKIIGDMKQIYHELSCLGAQMVYIKNLIEDIRFMIIERGIEENDRSN